MPSLKLFSSVERKLDSYGVKYSKSFKILVSLTDALLVVQYITDLTPSTNKKSLS